MNTSKAITFRVDGIVKGPVNPVQFLNAPLPIVFIVDGIVKEPVKLLQFWNTLFPIAVTRESISGNGVSEVGRPFVKPVIVTSLPLYAYINGPGGRVVILYLNVKNGFMSSDKIYVTRDANWEKSTETLK